MDKGIATLTDGGYLNPLSLWREDFLLENVLCKESIVGDYHHR